MSFFQRLELAKKQDLAALALKMNQEELDTIRHNRCQMRKHPGEVIPSMKFYKDTNSFYCFGCKSGGSTIDYVMGVLGVGMYEAVRKVESYFGLKRIRSETGIRTKLARESVHRIKGKLNTSSFDASEYASQLENELRGVFGRMEKKFSTPEGRQPLWREVDLVYADIDRAVELGASKNELDELRDFYKAKFEEMEGQLDRVSDFAEL